MMITATARSSQRLVAWLCILAVCVLVLPAPTESFLSRKLTLDSLARSLPELAGTEENGSIDSWTTASNGSNIDLSSTSNGKKTTLSNSNGNKKRRRRTRTPDYPSFAYDIMETNRRAREPLVMKRRDTISGAEEIFRTTTSSSYVSVPQQKNGGTSLLQSLTNVLLGTPLEGGINIINQSARQTRLRAERSYARREPFEMENIAVPPSLSDLSPPAVTPFERFWISTTARFLYCGGFYFVFPYITRFVDSFVTMPTAQLDEITSKFGPGISILYGTFISLTLSILYNRQRTIQDNVGTECAYLVVLTRNLLSLYANHRERAIEAGQCVADQIRTLVRSSRGAELMLLMYSDPYARMRELIDVHEQELFDDYNDDENNSRKRTPYDGRMNSLIANARDAIKDLYRVRAMRLSDEALALPPTHFLILNILTLLILFGYTVSIIPTLGLQSDPSPESCLLFAVLSTVYVLFYNFASDLNGPFDGVYQIRRSCAASHLLQIKWLIANHPLLRGEIDFEETEEDCTMVQIHCPGLGELTFDRDELFVDDAEVDEMPKAPRPPSL